MPARLFKRSLDLLPLTLENIKVFVEAASRKFGSVREGDQYGNVEDVRKQFEESQNNLAKSPSPFAISH
jgi:hypothetical protein